MIFCVNPAKKIVNIDLVKYDSEEFDSEKDPEYVPLPQKQKARR